MSVAGRPVLERAGSYSEVREQAVAILREGNEDPAAFRVTSPYRVIEVTRYRGGPAAGSSTASSASGAHTSAG